MPDTKYEREVNRFDCLGLELNRPVDSCKPQKFPYLYNVRSYQYGRLEPRLGLTDLGAPVASATPVHSVRRLNDPATGSYTRIVGTGTHLAIGQTSPYTDIDFGYSGEPLALVPWRPDQSPTPYMYVADRARMRNPPPTGILDTIGYAPPPTAPNVALNFPIYKSVNDFDSAAGWANATDMGAPTTTSRVNTTVTQALYDTGTNAWATFSCASMEGIGIGT